MKALAKKPADFNIFRVARRRREKQYEADRAKAVKAGQDLPPEPQYRRRKADPILNLYSRNHLTERQYMAAVDIRMVAEGITAAALKTSFNPSKFALAGTGRNGGAAPLWPAGDSMAGVRQQFSRWRNRARERKVGRVSWYRVAKAVVVLHRAPTDLDTVYRWRKGTAVEVLRKALDLY